MPRISGMWSTGRIEKLKELWSNAWSGKMLAAELNKLPGPPVPERAVMRMARTLALPNTSAHAARGIGPQAVRGGSAAYRPEQSQVELCGHNVSQDNAFCTAMQAAIDQCLEHAPFGIVVIDDNDVRAARTFIPVVAPASYVGSPAAACAES